MKTLRLFCVIAIFSLSGGLMNLAQAAAQTTRPVVLTWVASTSSSVTGYNIFRCTVVPPAIACTPAVTGTSIGTVTGVTYTDSAVPVQATYGYSVVAVAPACTGTSSPTVPCGNSAPATLNSVPVPPQTGGATNIIVVVP